MLLLLKAAESVDRWGEMLCCCVQHSRQRRIQRFSRVSRASCCPKRFPPYAGFLRVIFLCFLPQWRLQRWRRRRTTDANLPAEKEGQQRTMEQRWGELSAANYAQMLQWCIYSRGRIVNVLLLAFVKDWVALYLWEESKLRPLNSEFMHGMAQHEDLLAGPERCS